MGRTVLIVDDHPSFRASARRMLEADGYDVVGEAADGTSAIDAARALRPDLVLLDVRLPDFDGFQVAERLAANGRTPAIVLTSSRDRSDFGYDIDACAADGFIPKSELSAEAIALLIRCPERVPRGSDSSSPHLAWALSRCWPSSTASTTSTAVPMPRSRSQSAGGSRPLGCTPGHAARQA